MIEAVWTFLRDPQNQATLGWLAGGLATAAGAVWAALGRRRGGPAPADANQPSRNGADRRSPLPALALVVLGVALLVAMWTGGCIVGVGICNPGTIENSPITIEGG